MAKKDKRQNDRLGSLVLAVLLMLAGALLLLKPTWVVDQSTQSSVEAVSKRTRQSVNRNLKAADIRLQLEDLKNKIQREKAARIRPGDENTGRLDVGDLRTQQQSHGESVVKDIEEFRRSDDDRVLEPAEIIERRLARQQKIEDYDRKYKREYVKAFLQRAREQGYEVELNEDLEVIDIREAPLNEPLRFPNSVPSGSSAAQ